jgi:hypothetical protein
VQLCHHGAPVHGGPTRPQGPASLVGDGAVGGGGGHTRQPAGMTSQVDGCMVHCGGGAGSGTGLLQVANVCSVAACLCCCCCSCCSQAHYMYMAGPMPPSSSPQTRPGFFPGNEGPPPPPTPPPPPPCCGVNPQQYRHHQQWQPAGPPQQVNSDEAPCSPAVLGVG